MLRKQLLCIAALLSFLGLALRAQTPTIPTPQQTDQIITDPNSNGKADPGDRIRYKVTIQNTGTGNATGTKLQANPDSRTTLDGTSFRTSPLAMPDAYTCLGNVGITVPDGASDLLANDYDDNPAGLNLTPVTNAATMEGGSITIAADGSFSYNPPRGFEGTDTYNYTLNDGNAVAGVTATDVGTVTITVSGMIWFVNNNAGACASSCDGRMSNPYTSLAAFNTANGLSGGLDPDNNDNIFIYESATAYTGGIVLRNGQKLIGQDATVTLNVATGLSQPTFGNALPVTNSANGTVASITNAAGDGVTLASGNTLRGFSVGNCSDFAIENSGTNTVGDLMISETSISNTTGGGFDASNGSGFGMNVVLSSLSSSGGINGINLVNCGGSFSVNGGTISNPSGTGAVVSGGSVVVSCFAAITDNSGLAVDIDNHDSGNVTFAGNINSTGSGIRVQNCGGGTKTFSGSSKPLNTGANAAVTLSSNTNATINFTGGGLVITTTSGTGFNATGGGTVNVTGSGNTINATSATALNVASTTIGASGLTFQSISSGNNTAAADPANGIVLNTTGSSGGLTVTGTGSAGTGGTIQNTTGDAVNLNSANSISMSWMTINNAGQSWIDAASVTGLTLSNVNCDYSNSHGFLGSTVRNLVITNGIYKNGGQGAGAANFDGFNITNLLGTCSMTGTTVQRSNTRQMYVINNTATVAYPTTPTDIFTMSGTTWNEHNVGAFFGDHIIFSCETGSNFRVITNSTSGTNTFGFGGVGINLFASGNGHIQGSIKGLTASHCTSAVAASITGSGSATNDFRVEGNSISNTGSLAMTFVNTSTGTGVMQGIVHNNTVEMNAGSGYDAMQAITEGNGTTHFQFSLNTVTGNFQRGISAVSRVGTGVMNATINNNTVTNSDPAGLQCFRMEVGASGGGTTNTLRLNMYSNSGTSAGATGYRLLHRTGYTFQLQDFVGDGSSATDVQTWINTTKSNTGTGTITVGPGFTASAGAIPTPNLPAGL